MFQSLQRARGKGRAGLAVNMTPLIDMVFILLIFFMVTTTFVRDSGIGVTRPQATQRHAFETGSLRISIAASGAIYADGEQHDFLSLRSRVSQFLGESPDGSVIVIPDERTPSGVLVAVMDVAKMAGATDMGIATREKLTD